MAREDLTVAEAAAELGVPRQHVLNWITRKKLSGRKRGWNWFIPAQEIRRFERELSKGPPIYYVYLHRISQDKVFYVGRSKDPDRAYELIPHRHNQEYDVILKKHKTEISVEIVKQGLSHLESWKLEQELIRRFRVEGHPITNTVPLR